MPMARRVVEPKRWSSCDGWSRRRRGRYVPPVQFAILQAALGNTDVAFDWLEESYRQRDATLRSRIFTPGLDELHSDPRFADLLDRLGLADR